MSQPSLDLQFSRKETFEEALWFNSHDPCEINLLKTELWYQFASIQQISTLLHTRGTNIWQGIRLVHLQSGGRGYCGHKLPAAVVRKEPKGLERKQNHRRRKMGLGAWANYNVRIQWIKKNWIFRASHKKDSLGASHVPGTGDKAARCRLYGRYSSLKTNSNQQKLKEHNPTMYVT